MKEAVWVEIAVRVPAVLAAVVMDRLTALGSEGNVEDSLGEKGDPTLARPFVKGYLRGTPESLTEEIAAFRAFVEGLKGLDLPGEIGEVVARSTSEEEWQEWKKFFKPLAVSERVVIKPTWEPYAPRGGEVVVEIDPGMAFGTGTHESTRMCLRLLDEVIAGGETLFDVGTGSGILAIAAVKLGAGRVTAIDNHADSVRVARENAALNRVEGAMDLSATPLDAVAGTFDIVVANILAEDLIEMVSSLVAHTRPGGRIILSGILTVKARMVVAAYEARGAILEKQLEEWEWSALLFRR